MSEDIIKEFFPSNHNAWWEFNQETGLLSICGAGEVNAARYRPSGRGGGYKLWSLHFDKIKNVNVSTKIQPLTMANWFCNCENLESFDFWNIDTSKCIDMSGMFYSCFNLKEIKTFGCDTSSCLKMNNMFCGCSKLIFIDLSVFDTSHVTDMNNMFCECRNIETIDLSNFNTENVIDMSAMFFNCFYLKEIKGIENFMTSNLQNMNRMFAFTQNLELLDLLFFNFDKIEDLALAWLETKSKVIISEKYHEKVCNLSLKNDTDFLKVLRNVEFN